MPCDCLIAFSAPSTTCRKELRSMPVFALGMALVHLVPISSILFRVRYRVWFFTSRARRGDRLGKSPATARRWAWVSRRGKVGSFGMLV